MSTGNKIGDDEVTIPKRSKYVSKALINSTTEESSLAGVESTTPIDKIVIPRKLRHNAKYSDDFFLVK